MIEADGRAATPEAAHAISTLAVVLRRSGELDKAKSLLERALAIDELEFGHSHPKTAVRLLNLSVALRDMGDVVGARARIQSALKILEDNLGTDHPKTRMARRHLDGLG